MGLFSKYIFNVLVQIKIFHNVSTTYLWGKFIGKIIGLYNFFNKMNIRICNNKSDKVAFVNVSSKFLGTGFCFRRHTLDDSLIFE